MDKIVQKSINAYGQVVDEGHAGVYACYVHNHTDIVGKCSGDLSWFQLEVGTLGENGRPAIHAPFCDAHKEIGKVREREAMKAAFGKEA